jgi:hypothetical protein
MPAFCCTGTRGSGRRVIQLIDDPLNLSRLTSSVLQFEPVDLGAIAEELIHCRPERNVEFVISEAAKVDGDPRLPRILLEVWATGEVERRYFLLLDRQDLYSN